MPIDMKAMTGHTPLSESMAYAQSKLAITMWSAHMAAALPDGPAVIAVNPASLLGTKMVKEAYGSEAKISELARIYWYAWRWRRNSPIRADNIMTMIAANLARLTPMLWIVKKSLRS